MFKSCLLTITNFLIKVKLPTNIHFSIENKKLCSRYKKFCYFFSRKFFQYFNYNIQLKKLKKLNFEWLK